MEWISVKERLPEEETSVLVWAEWADDPGGYSCELAMLCDGNWYNNGVIAGELHYKLTVTHWMPLPAPPKE